MGAHSMSRRGTLIGKISAQRIRAVALRRERDVNIRLKKVSSVVDRRNIVAIGLLSREDLQRLGSAYQSAIPVQDVPAFEDLLLAIDEAQNRADIRRH